MRCAFSFLTFVLVAAGTSFLDQHIYVLQRMHAAYTKDSDKVDVGFLRFVIELHDDDARCEARCVEQLNKFLLSPLKHEKGPAAVAQVDAESGLISISFSRFRALLEQIYAGEVSSDPYQPQEIHLALTSASSSVGSRLPAAEATMSMKAMWVTMGALEYPIVQYLPAAGNGEYNWAKAAVAAAATSTYRVEKKWWPIFTGVIYDADMTSLVPDAAYVYRVGGYSSANATMRFSEAFDFRAPPRPHGDKDRPTVICTLADHGTFEFFGFAVVDKMIALREELGFEMVHVAGDLSYAGLSSDFPPLDITSEDEFEHIWDLLFIQNQILASKMAWMSGDGNHERFYNYSALQYRYQMPQSVIPFEEGGAAPSNGNFWYQYTYGNTRWISISSEHDLSSGSPQMTFLTAALVQAQSERDIVPWVIVTIHKPPYCSDAGTPGGYADFLEDTFVYFDVDLVISGHLHVYERISPVYKGSVTCLPIQQNGGLDAYLSTGKGPVYVVQGNAGAMQWDRWVEPQPQWSQYRMSNGLPPQIQAQAWEAPPAYTYSYTDTYGFGVVATSNSTHLQYTSIPITGTFVDSFWIVKRVV